MYPLQNFDREQFLRQYWQRQPLLIKNALPGFENPLSADALAGLALEQEVESRIVQRAGSAWVLEHGPFAHSAFNRSEPWTLLVQAVDHYLEEVAELWRLADFLPSWRRDDVMVSFATAGAGVGPHYDNYDVFLLQGLGQRRWRLGQWCSGKDALLPHESLRILADFQQSADYLLHPGDILYLPPCLAHWGEAVTDCMTYSLGFRAPGIKELLSRCLDDQLEHMDTEQFYTDPPLFDDASPGEISAAAAQRALELVQACVAGLAQNTQWLGELVTEPRYPLEPVDPEETMLNPHVFRLEPAARLAWAINREPGDGESLSVYANGISLSAPSACLPLLQDLSQQRAIEREKLNTLAGEKDMLELLAQLMKVGCIYGE